MCDCAACLLLQLRHSRVAVADNISIIFTIFADSYFW